MCTQIADTAIFCIASTYKLLDIIVANRRERISCFGVVLIYSDSFQASIMPYCAP